MVPLLGLLSAVSMILLIVGLFRPSWAVPGKLKPSRWKVVGIYFGVMMLCSAVSPRPEASEADHENQGEAAVRREALETVSDAAPAPQKRIAPKPPTSLTALSAKAARLEMGMNREGVIRLLGPATWASIPGDTGDLALPDPRIGLELYWRNPGCFPVAVDFDPSMKVSGYALDSRDPNI